ncbi:MAG: SAM-dependent methyltransferase, partial [Lactobacillus sp.]|nr:SAM-dependent methyltransferase [Lactobacillus sp.]
MPNTIDTKIKKALVESKDYLDLLAIYAKNIKTESKKANSEETIATIVEYYLGEALKWYGVRYNPIREQTIKGKNYLGKITNKRIDSRYNNIIFEYKKNIDSNPELHLNQLKEYMLLSSAEEKQGLNKYFGILTDGNKCQFVSPLNESLISSELLEINKTTLKEIVKVILSIDRKDLSSKNLMKDFSVTNENTTTKNLLKSLYEQISNPNDRTFMLHSEWERIFKLATSNDSNMKQVKARDAALSACFDMNAKNFNPTIGLFALQTAYTIIIKLIAYYIVVDIFFSKSDLNIKDLLKLDSKTLRSRLEYIENGEIFKHLGISNLLEGDFFSWYVFEDTWSEEIYSSIRDCIETLGNYDSNQYIFDVSNIHDLFIDLYQAIIPTEVRRSLGEYYTPGWLAEHVIDNVEKELGWTGLDPCAGSGTFILEMIKKVVKEKKHTQHEDIIGDVIKRVKAIDINPLAVLTCRLNYFIAISRYLDIDNFKHFEIPVYLGDSAFVPKSEIIENVKMITYSITTKKGDFTFSLPESLITSKKNITQNIVQLENAIISLNSKKAEDILLDILPKKDKIVHVIKSIRAFVDNLIILEKQNWDRIWVRIIVGFLKIATLDKFSIITGNPPWIDWKTLPEGYRNTLKSICVDRHLFSGDNFVGGINLNVCALITNVVSNNWLKKDGTLAFLMPKSMVFQQSYTGFRNLVQNDGINLSFKKFHDWSQSGHPFYPVTEKFMTYFLKKSNLPTGDELLCKAFTLKKGLNINKERNIPLDEIIHSFDIKDFYAFKNNNDSLNNFTFADKKENIQYLKKVAGRSQYKGRVGLGLYPKELLLFKIVNIKNNIAIVENYQGKTTERKF